MLELFIRRKRNACHICLSTDDRLVYADPSDISYSKLPHLIPFITLFNELTERAKR